MTRDSLTGEAIVDAAIELLDQEGLEGLSMRSLGARLGSVATAVYWHVGSKDDLIALAADRLWSQLSLPANAATDWRAAATSLACELHAMLMRHRWLLEAFGPFFTFGEGKARYDDRWLAVCEEAGFEGTAIDQAAGTIFIFVLGSALGPTAAAALDRKLERGGRDARQAMRDHAAEARAIAKRFPRLRARLDTPSARNGASADDTFEFGLAAVLDGFEAQLARKNARPKPKPKPNHR